MSRFTVAVTEKHVTDSIQASSSHCMIADAIKAAKPDANFVSVDLATVRYSVDKKRYVFATPGVAQAALLDFDAGRPVEPFKFQLSTLLQVVEAKPSPRGLRATATRRGQSKPAKEEHRNMRPAEQPRAVRGPFGTVPVVVGGSTPPVGPLGNDRNAVRVGRRRAYGLRSMATRFGQTGQG